MINKEEMASVVEHIRDILNMLKNHEETQERCEILKANLISLPSAVRPMVRDPEDSRIVNLAGYMAFTYPFKQEFFKCIVEHLPYTLFQDHKEPLLSGDFYHESGSNISSLPKVILPLKLAIDQRNLQMTTSILASSALQTDVYAPLTYRAIFLIDNICYGISSYYNTNALIEDEILVAMNKAVYSVVQESIRIGDSSIINNLKAKIIPAFESRCKSQKCAMLHNIDQKIIVFLQGLELAFEEGKVEAKGLGV